MKLFFLRKPRAFTLIELLIVVAIIGILAAIAVPNFLNARMRALVSRAMAEERNLKTALESYHVDHNHYPPKNQTPTGPRVPVYQRYAMLTTPVAYMASIPMDPFFTVQSENDPRNSSTLWGGAYYDYFEWETEGYIYKKGVKAGKLYFIASYGPDFAKTTGDVNGVTEMLQYDLSNGVTSSGDIVVYGP